MKHKESSLKEALLLTLPIMTGYVFLGFAFGLLMKSKGYPNSYPILMSVLIYSGALEFAAVPLLAQPFDPLGSFILGLLLSARHLFYGLPMLKKYKGCKGKPFLIFGLTDETFSLLSTMDIEEEKKSSFYLEVTAFDHFYWNLGTLLGTLFGSIISVSLDGLDFALTALFIVLFLEQLKDRKGKISGAIGLCLSFIVLLAFGPSSMVIISMFAILAALLGMRKAIEE